MKRKSTLSIVLILAIVIAAVCMLQVSALAAGVPAADFGGIYYYVMDPAGGYPDTIDVVGQVWHGAAWLTSDHNVTINAPAGGTTWVGTDPTHSQINPATGTTTTLNGFTFSAETPYAGSYSIVLGGAGDVVFENCAFTGKCPIVITGTGNVTFKNCTFSSFYNMGWGGAVAHAGSGKMTVENCTFNGGQSWTAGGTAGRGGAIAVTNAAATLEVKNSTFTNCIADGEGGAIYSAGAVTVEDSTFTNNGFYPYSGTPTVITPAGGAIKADGALTVKGSTFTGNAGGEGGAIYASAALIIDQSASGARNTFSGNSATVAGGAIRPKSTTSVKYADFDGNNGGSVAGGAIGSWECTALTVADSTFKENTAPTGGAIYASTGWTVMNITDSTFEENSVAGNGGAVYNEKGSLEATRTIFTANAAAVSGGAVAGTQVYANFNLSEFTGNVANTGDGGAVYVYGAGNDSLSKIIATGCLITGNEAGGNGGAFCGNNMDPNPTSGTPMGGIIVSNGSIVDGNSAAKDGGALYSWAWIIVDESTVSNNSSMQNGGAIWSNWNVNVENGAALTHNWANWHGGAIYCELGTAYVADSDLTYNTAQPTSGGHGAVIYTNSAEILAEECYLYGNKSNFNNDDFYAATPGTSVQSIGCYYSKAVQVGNGTKITLTIIPAEGYELDTIKIYDADGNVYIPTYTGDNEYVVIIPDYENVEISVDATYRISRECLIEKFQDIADDYKYHEAVDFVFSNGIMNGVSENEFAPNVNTTRGMVITTLYRMYGAPAVTGENNFADVADGEWYTDAIIWGVEMGLVNGYGNGNFGPNDLITREQLAAIMYRFAKSQGYDVDKTASLIGFKNFDKTGEYSKDAIKWAVSLNFWQGSTRTPVDLIGYVPRIELANAIMAAVK